MLTLRSTHGDIRVPLILFLICSHDEILCGIFFVFYKKFFYFLTVLGLHCCLRAFSNCCQQELLLIVVCSLLIAVASFIAEHRLEGMRASEVAVLGLSSCDSWAWLLQDMCDLPGPGVEPMSPALAGRLLSTAPPGKSLFFVF